MEKQPQTGRPKGKEEISCLKEGTEKSIAEGSNMLALQLRRESRNDPLLEVQRIRISQ